MNSSEDFFEEFMMKHVIDLLRVRYPVARVVVVQEMTGEEFRTVIECDPAISCVITDRDMLLLQIDWGIDAGGEVLFKLLVAEL